MERDMFDDIILAEDRVQQEGFDEGMKVGEPAGYEEGFRLGLVQGKQIAAEVGFYIGFCETWQNKLQGTDGLKPRHEKALASLVALLQAFSLDDPERSSLQDDLAKIRAKFKQVTSLLNINVGQSEVKKNLAF